MFLFQCSIVIIFLDMSYIDRYAIPTHIIPIAMLFLDVLGKDRCQVPVQPGPVVCEAGEDGRQTHVGAQRETEAHQPNLSAGVTGARHQRATRIPL